MPNHVKHEIKVIADHKKINEIKSLCLTDNKFDFEKLIPRPKNLYRGDLSSTDIKDFGKNSWYEWNITNWGSKWNTYDCDIKESDTEIKILFTTAWSVPYPIIIAFANIIGIGFEHIYSCEGTEYWGYEKWVLTIDNIMSRTEKRYEDENDKWIIDELWGMDS